MDRPLDRLKKVRTWLGMSQAQLSKAINYPLSSISAIEAGNQKLPIQLAYRLQEVIVADSRKNVRVINDLNPKKDDEAFLRPEWLFKGTGNEFDNGRISDCCSKINITTLDTDVSISLPFGKNIIFYEMSDDSMEPLFLEKDLVAIDSNEKNIISGKIYLLRIFDEYLLRKLYNIDEGAVSIASLNDKIVPRITVEKSELNILGRYSFLIRPAK